MKHRNERMHRTQHSVVNLLKPKGTVLPFCSKRVRVRVRCVRACVRVCVHWVVVCVRVRASPKKETASSLGLAYNTRFTIRFPATFGRLGRERPRIFLCD
jgi:hypothetical protein